MFVNQSEAASWTVFPKSLNMCYIVLRWKTWNGFQFDTFANDGSNSALQLDDDVQGSWNVAKICLKVIFSSSFIFTLKPRVEGAVSYSTVYYHDWQR